MGHRVWELGARATPGAPIRVHPLLRPQKLQEQEDLDRGAADDRERVEVHRRRGILRVRLGFGRIVVLEKKVPSILANMV